MFTMLMILSWLICYFLFSQFVGVAGYGSKFGARIWMPIIATTNLIGGPGFWSQSRQADRKIQIQGFGWIFCFFPDDSDLSMFYESFNS